MKTVLIVGVLALAVAGCGGGGSSTAAGTVSVAAAFYPLAEVARQVGGDLVSVVDLTPPGSEPHDLEITSAEVDRVLDAGLAVVLGHGFQPAIEDVAADRKRPTIVVLEQLLDSGSLAGDPHVWLDPILLADVVTLVADGLAEVAPGDAATFRANAARYREQLLSLDAEMTNGLSTCRLRQLVTAHASFGWLALRYDLTQEAIAGLSPDQEPDPARLAELAELVRAEGTTTIMTESLVSPEVADALAREVGLRTAVLNPLEGLTKDQLDAGDDYLSVMRDNLATLQRALECT